MSGRSLLRAVQAGLRGGKGVTIRYSSGPPHAGKSVLTSLLVGWYETQHHLCLLQFVDCPWSGSFCSRLGPSRPWPPVRRL